jgi:hypothetical protein
MMTRTLLAGLATALPLLAACGGGGSGGAAEGVVTRDSAGVAIVEHSEAAVNAVPVAMLGEATMSLGGEDATPEQDGTFYTRGWLLEDAVLALHNREATFRRFDAAGEVQASYGRRGQGPDEFQAVMPMRLGGDSLLLVEFTRSTARVLRSDLTAGAATAFGEGPAFEYQVFGAGPGGALVAIHRTMQPTTETSGPARRPPLHFVRRAAGATTWDTVVVTDGELAYPMMYNEGGHAFPMLRPVTFGAIPLQTVWGDRIVVVNNGDWTIQEYDFDGTPVRIVRFAMPLRASTQAMRDSIFARELRQMEQLREVPQGLKDQFVEMSRSQQFADSIAPYDRVLVARDGELWLRVNEMPVDTTTTWMRIGRDGRLAGRLSLPRGWMLLDADGDRALVRRTDELDLGYLEVRAISAGDR